MLSYSAWSYTESSSTRSPSTRALSSARSRIFTSSTTDTRGIVIWSSGVFTRNMVSGVGWWSSADLGLIIDGTAGKVVRFGPNCLSFNSSAALKDIYGFRANVGKAEFYDAFVHPAPNTHNSRDKDVHARKRRVLSHAFSDSATKEMQRYILNNVRMFCEQVGSLTGASEERKGWTVPKNMSDWTSYLAMDVLGDLSFGKAFQLLEKEDNRFAIKLVEAATTRHLIVSVLEPVALTA